MEQKLELSGIVQRALLLDVLLELAVGIALLGLVGHPHRWLDVDRSVTLIAAGVFFVAAAAVLAMALYPRTSRSSVRYLAFANVVGGIAVWAVAIANWDNFRQEGQWFVAAAADAFVLIGVLEFVALWVTRSDEI